MKYATGSPAGGAFSGRPLPLGRWHEPQPRPVLPVPAAGPFLMIAGIGEGWSRGTSRSRHGRRAHRRANRSRCCRGHAAAASARQDLRSAAGFWWAEPGRRFVAGFRGGLEPVGPQRLAIERDRRFRRFGFRSSRSRWEAAAGRAARVVVPLKRDAQRKADDADERCAEESLHTASVRRILPALRDSVDAAAVARKDVLGPIDADARPQGRAEQIELAGAKALARGGGGANRAVILDKQKSRTVALHFGHVPFIGADPRELLHSLREGADASMRDR